MHSNWELTLVTQSLYEVARKLKGHLKSCHPILEERTTNDATFSEIHLSGQPFKQSYVINADYMPATLQHYLTLLHFDYHVKTSPKRGCGKVSVYCDTKT
jgi:hypothetical protein